MKIIMRSLFLATSILLGWQALIWLWDLPAYILPSPREVLQALITYRTVILQQSIPTLIETLLGFMMGVLFGCLAGTVVAICKPLRLWFLPLLIISQAIPTFAIAPLLIMWLGYGISSKIMTAIIIIFFPVCSALYDGLRSTPAHYLELAKSMHASFWRLFYFIKLPAAMGSLASGLRIAAVGAPIGAVVGEWVGSSKGLGYLMINANARLQIDLMFAALLLIVILALSLYLLVDKFLIRLLPSCPS